MACAAAPDRTHAPRVASPPAGSPGGSAAHSARVRTRAAWSSRSGSLPTRTARNSRAKRPGSG
eukprot:8116233-Lingulodinium_polyedra.AAC.1